MMHNQCVISLRNTTPIGMVPITRKDPLACAATVFRRHEHLGPQSSSASPLALSDS